MKKRISPRSVGKCKTAVGIVTPRANEFYDFHTEEFSGLIPEHSVRVSFVIPYRDWCEPQFQTLIDSLKDYLEAIRKRKFAALREVEG